MSKEAQAIIDDLKVLLGAPLTSSNPSGKKLPEYSSKVISEDIDEEIELSEDMSRNLGLLTTAAAIAVNQKGLSAISDYIFVANCLQCYINGVNYQANGLIGKYGNSKQEVEP